MPEERNKNNQKNAKTISNVVHKLYFFLVFLVFFAHALHGRKVNDAEMPESKTKADTDPKMAQNGPRWAQMAQDEPNMVPILAQQKPTDTYRNHKIPQKWLNVAQNVPT